MCVRAHYTRADLRNNEISMKLMMCLLSMRFENESLSLLLVGCVYVCVFLSLPLWWNTSLNWNVRTRKAHTILNAKPQHVTPNTRTSNRFESLRSGKKLILCFTNKLPRVCLFFFRLRRRSAKKNETKNTLAWCVVCLLNGQWFMVGPKNLRINSHYGIVFLLASAFIVCYIAETLSICNRLLRIFGIFETARCLVACGCVCTCVHLHLNRFKYTHTHNYIINKVRLLTFALDTTNEE